MPGDTTNLETSYSVQDYLDVDTSDATRVAQTATDQIAIHQFKDYVGAQSSCTLSWTGQSNQSATFSSVVLQLYNENTTTWDTIATDSTTLNGNNIVFSENIADLTNYKTASSTITARVYQDDSP